MTIVIVQTLLVPTVNRMCFVVVIVAEVLDYTLHLFLDSFVFFFKITLV